MLNHFSRLISMLPLPAAMAFARILGLLWYYVVPIRRKLAMENINRALGNELTEAEQKKAVRELFVNFCMYLIEVIRIPHMTLEENEEQVQIDGWEHMEKALAKGKGVILVATHVDNVDLGGCSMAMRGAPIAVVVRKMGKTAEEFISSVRSNTGVTIISAKGTGGVIKDLLAENKIVTIVIDQHLARYRSIVCDFFGTWASTTPAPTRFGYETGAPLIPGVIQRKKTPGHHHVRIFPEFKLESPYTDQEDNVRHNTERLNRMVESWIREVPNQWWWFHKRWKYMNPDHGWEIPDKETYRFSDIGKR